MQSQLRDCIFLLLQSKNSLQYSALYFEKKEKIIIDKEDTTMQVKFKGYKSGPKIDIKMIMPTGEQKTVITMEMPQGGDWRADMECYDKVLSAYEERLDKAMQLAQLQQAEEVEQLEQA